MIEREFIKERMKQLRIKETIGENFNKGAEIGSVSVEKLH